MACWRGFWTGDSILGPLPIFFKQKLCRKMSSFFSSPNFLKAPLLLVTWLTRSQSRPVEQAASAGTQEPLIIRCINPRLSQAIGPAPLQHSVPHPVLFCMGLPWLQENHGVSSLTVGCFSVLASGFGLSAGDTSSLLPASCLHTFVTCYVLRF